MPNNLAERLRRWLIGDAEEPPANPLPQCEAIVECTPRARVKVSGVVQQLGINLETGWFEAQIADPTGSVRLIWMGMRRLTCLHEGAIVVAKGRLAVVEGQPTIYNPEFSVLPS